MARVPVYLTFVAEQETLLYKVSALDGVLFLVGRVVDSKRLFALNKRYELGILSVFVPLKAVLGIVNLWSNVSD